jgi:hypothetical protein
MCPNVQGPSVRYTLSKGGITSSQGRLVQGMARHRDASSKVRLVQGTARQRDASSETFRSGTHTSRGQNNIGPFKWLDNMLIKKNKTHKFVCFFPPAENTC